MKNDKIKFFDVNIYRREDLAKNNLQFIENKNIPLPAIVEISNSGTCNRVCSFCPRSDPNYPDLKEFISSELHEKIFKQLSEVDYQGVISYSGFNEPLLNKNIYRDIRQARDYLPKAKIEIVTNGDVLNISRLKKLFDHGLTTILISVYDGPEDYAKFEKMCKDANLHYSQYMVRKRYLSEDNDFGITINNRSGNLASAEHKILPLQEPLKKKCTYPSYTFFIDYNGDVLMCSHDWGKRMILGNMKNQNFLDIWTSKKSNFVRKKLNAAERNFSPSTVFDVEGTLIGKEQSKAWDKIIEQK